MLNIRQVARDASDSYVSTDLHEYYVTDTTILPLDLSSWQAGVAYDGTQPQASHHDSEVVRSEV